MAIIRRPPVQLGNQIVNTTSTDIRAYTTMEDIYARANNLGIRTFPFDIIGYLKAHNIAIEYEEMEDMSGYVECKKDLIVVGINKYQNTTRQRFTAAHELGHIINDMSAVENGEFKNGEVLLFRDNDSIGIRERLANEFASNLLMPKNLFEDLLKKGVRSIERLAEEFNVSPAAIRYRAYKLGYIQGY